MSRSGYTDDYGNDWQMICYRGAVASAIGGRRGQALLIDMLAALDDMPEKRLIADVLEREGEFCALGVLGQARGLDMEDLDPECPDQIAGRFNIAESMAREITYLNDEHGRYDESPEMRFHRMRQWVVENIKQGQGVRCR